MTSGFGGHHRLLCGDATRVDDLRRALDGRLADLVFTDPPYNVAYQGKSAGRRKSPTTTSGQVSRPSSQAACFAMLPLTKGALYICMSSAQIGT